MSSTRVQWMSENARAVWEPRISAITRAWGRAEVDSVVAGLRPACYVDVSAVEYESRWQELDARGLAVLVADLHGDHDGYAARSTALTPGAPVKARLAVARESQSAVALVGATRDRDDELAGQLLGYPRCCRESFDRWWGEKTEPPTDDAERYMPAANLFLRWIGVRAVSHLPCRMNCPSTAIVAVEMTRVMPQVDRSWLWDALQWPTLYTARNEIAVVETPVLRIVGEADPGTRRVELSGSTWPTEGARGVRFPLKTPAGCTPIVSGRRLEQEHVVNGFASVEAMLDSHEAVLASLPDACAVAERVVDLGCGSGRLATLVAGRLGVSAAGCDVSDEAVAWARTVYPDGEWWTGDAEAYSPISGDVVMTTPARQPVASGLEAATWLYQYRGEGGFIGGDVPAKVEIAA